MVLSSLFFWVVEDVIIELVEKWGSHESSSLLQLPLIVQSKRNINLPISGKFVRLQLPRLRELLIDAMT